MDDVEWYKSRFRRAESGFNAEFYDDLEDSVQQVASYLEKLAESNPEKELVFVVGGKSAAIVKKLFEKVKVKWGYPTSEDEVERLPCIELGSEDNQRLYKESVRRYKRYGNEPIPKQIATLDKNKSLIIYVDDHVFTGVKAGEILDWLDKNGFNTRFVSFSGPDDPDQMSSDKLKLHADRYFAPKNQSIEYLRTMKGLSRIWSDYKTGNLIQNGLSRSSEDKNKFNPVNLIDKLKRNNLG